MFLGEESSDHQLVRKLLLPVQNHSAGTNSPSQRPEMEETDLKSYTARGTRPCCRAQTTHQGQLTVQGSQQHCAERALGSMPCMSTAQLSVECSKAHGLPLGPGNQRTNALVRKAGRAIQPARGQRRLLRYRRTQDTAEKNCTPNTSNN